MGKGNYKKPVELLDAVVAYGAAKAQIPLADMILRGVYSGVLLGFATTLAVTASVQTVPIVGALLFPCGFSLIILLGFELVTGNMAVIPISLMAKKAEWKGMLKNWVVVWCANYLGCLLYMALYYVVVTQAGELPKGGEIGRAIIGIGQAKTVKYAYLGPKGLLVCFVKAILCNWMVCVGTIGSLVSTSMVGKTLGAWLPVLMFFAQGFEHCVVNMFAIPMSMLLGSGVTFSQWWFWNIIPVTLGNLFAAVVFVALPFWYTHGHEYRAKSQQQSGFADVSSEPASRGPSPFPFQSCEAKELDHKLDVRVE